MSALRQIRAFKRIIPSMESFRSGDPRLWAPQAALGMLLLGLEVRQSENWAKRTHGRGERSGCPVLQIKRRSKAIRNQKFFFTSDNEQNAFFQHKGESNMM